MSLRRCAAFLAPAVIAAVAWPATAGATLPGLNGRIAFVRPGSGIWEVNPDGSGLIRISSPTSRWSECDSEPAFSPEAFQQVGLRRQLGQHDFESGFALVGRVQGAVDHRHAPLGDRGDNLI